MKETTPNKLTKIPNRSINYFLKRKPTKEYVKISLNKIHRILPKNEVYRRVNLNNGLEIAIKLNIKTCATRFLLNKVLRLELHLGYCLVIHIFVLARILYYIHLFT